MGPPAIGRCATKAAAKGNASDAKSMFERALVIKPGYDEAKANLSKLKGVDK